MKEVKLSELTGAQKRAIDAAEEALKTSYNPYSNFAVAAALITSDGEIITGSNVENAAYGSTICAERSALVRANAMGKRDIKSLVVMTGAKAETSKVSMPCGACRQMIYEASRVSGSDIEVIHLSLRKDKVLVSPISELLPFAFGPDDIGVDLSRFRD